MRMKHAFRRLLCLLLSAAALLSLAACTSPLEEKLWEILTPTLVQGDLDALYLGEFNENYLDLTGASEEDCPVRLRTEPLPFGGHLRPVLRHHEPDGRSPQ